MIMYECTIDRELTGAVAHTRGRHFIFTHYVAAQHFSA